MANILEKRLSLHRHLAEQENVNSALEGQIKRMQGLANIGIVSAMAAHEMNNILTPMGNYAQLSIKHPEDAELARKAIYKAAANAERASKILQSMLSMANGKNYEKKDQALKELLDEVFTCIGRDFSRDNIKVSINIDNDLTIWTEGICMQQVLMNLILNARDAMLARGGSLRIQAEQTCDLVRIEVSDTGCGIEPGNLGRIFEPFFTTKDGESKLKRTGAGLGLTFCKRVIAEHDGTISVESRLNEGTAFTITLPIH